MANIDDDDELEWEEWDKSKISFLKHMTAGSIAGLVEHLTIFPIDTIKTNVQCDKCGSNSPLNFINCARKIVKREGFFRLWRGVTATFAGCIPAHAAYFSIYEAMKSSLGVSHSDHRPVRAAICGASATLAHDLILTPFDVIKQRLQLGYYKGLQECTRLIYTAEGIKAFYLSLPTTLLMNIPYGCIMVATNESMKKFLNPSGQYSFFTSMIAGTVAGGIAAAFTNPLDVIKTRLQTQDLAPCQAEIHSSSSSSTCSTIKLSVPRTSPLSRLPSDISYSQNISSTIKKFSTAAGNPIINDSTNPKYTNALQAFTRIVKEEGLLGLTRGMIPRICVQAPAVAISWTAYETMKMLLEKIE